MPALRVTGNVGKKPTIPRSEAGASLTGRAGEHGPGNSDADRFRRRQTVRVDDNMTAAEEESVGASMRPRR
jgi:hypothetical protein